jgi:glycosyltransferase involved in cell wall biosynthesis
MAGPTVEFRGHVPDAEVRHLMETCKALIFPGEEDFGITPVEAAACGKPVLAYKGGGALETVIEGETGCFFDQAHVPLVNAMLACEATKWNPDRIRANAERFSEARFHDRIGRVMAMAMEAKERARAGKTLAEAPGLAASSAA